jgi:hypothetical protein
MKFKEFVRALSLGPFYVSNIFTVFEAEHNSWSSRKCIVFVPEDYAGEIVNLLSILKN